MREDAGLTVSSFQVDHDVASPLQDVCRHSSPQLRVHQTDPHSSFPLNGQLQREKVKRKKTQLMQVQEQLEQL